MVYGWGSNDYLATGLGRFNPKQTLKPGRDRGDVAEPAKVSGPLSDGSYRISSLVAGEPGAALMLSRTTAPRVACTLIDAVGFPGTRVCLEFRSGVGVAVS